MNMKLCNQANRDVRNAAAEAGFYLWEVAEALGIADGTFSRKLRNELSDSEKEAVCATHTRADCAIPSPLLKNPRKPGSSPFRTLSAISHPDFSSMISLHFREV